MEQREAAEVMEEEVVPCPTPQVQHNAKLVSLPVGSEAPVAGVRHNTVSAVMLTGVPIVSLVIDGKERLCLAQISNTLLKSYSYNEIHNRRVALGITCVQCTPVQLEILRRAGAMPISSRRCGMITKREAERLVKSFLEDIRPPKLPDNFSFDVVHECGWGCRGSFTPSRYNSSRAKCIKCHFCQMYFSPNKFIFHFHRTADAKYQHPDAANFNSWRRHLFLADPEAPDDLQHAWEDVKAMFNGGSRKRVLCPISSSSSSSSHSPSRSSCAPPKLSPGSDYGKQSKLDLDPLNSRPTTALPPQHIQYPLFPSPNKIAVSKPGPPHPAFNVSFAYEKPPSPERMNSGAPVAWPAVPETYYPPYEMIWAKHLGLTAPESGFAPHAVPRDKSTGDSEALTCTSVSDARLSKDTNPCEDTEFLCGGRVPVNFISSFPSGRERRHPSAFTPVGHHPIIPLSPEGCHNQMKFGRPGSVSPSPTLDHECTAEAADTVDYDQDEHVDVDTVDDDAMEENNNNLRSKKAEEDELICSTPGPSSSPNHSPNPRSSPYKDPRLNPSPCLHHSPSPCQAPCPSPSFSPCPSPRPTPIPSPCPCPSPKVVPGQIEAVEGSLAADMERTIPPLPCPECDQGTNVTSPLSKVHSDQETTISKPTSREQNDIETRIASPMSRVQTDQGETISLLRSQSGTEQESTFFSPRSGTQSDQEANISSPRCKGQSDLETRVSSPTPRVQTDQGEAASLPRSRSWTEQESTVFNTRSGMQSDQDATVSRPRSRGQGDLETPASSSRSRALSDQGMSLVTVDSNQERAVRLTSPSVNLPEVPADTPRMTPACDSKPQLGKDVETLSKEQLQEELLQVLEARRRLEQDCKLIQENFSEQVRRELAYREEMAQQLHVVRETLCQELEQERKARFTLQQKLKEAHDALHSFSCTMLASRQCQECAYKEPVLPH